ncbi:MAG: lipid-A-disaccharide synthase [Bacteroidia bacterium]|nr:lipid-A-disaccharide synthase [Bacteroidia bacterium]MCZ2248104.1 lipid-A-disaccharide synthase [Bacteroidia bacterium]
MKYYIIAGEPSGDLHGSNLIKHLKNIDLNADFRAWGGNRMSEQGATLFKHIKDLAFMGFVEVVANIGTILKNIRLCKEDILKYKPDVLVLIDYPGFNLRIAKFAKKQKIKVVYYISPQIWAWKENRIHHIKSYVDRMIVILPFEEEFYRKHHYPVFYAGHPLLDAIDDILNNSNTKNEFLKINLLADTPIIALLPGSRKQEIQVMLPQMLKMIKHFKEYQFIVACSNNVQADIYHSMVKGYPVKLVYDQTYQLLLHSKAALVTSGTATLETALFNVPEIVCYKGNFISYFFAKKLIKVNFISLVNLIMNREIVKELIQYDFNEEMLKSNLIQILQPEHQQWLKNEYSILKEKLGGKGASARAAKYITDYLTEN